MRKQEGATLTRACAEVPIDDARRRRRISLYPAVHDVRCAASFTLSPGARQFASLDGPGCGAVLGSISGR